VDQPMPYVRYVLRLIALSVVASVTVGSVVKSSLFADVASPTSFLFVSSPLERKVVYTELLSFVPLSDHTSVLIDSGLVEPRGVAFDRVRGRLYVADPGAQMIYRYSILMEHDNGLHLRTDGSRHDVTSANASWLAVNFDGDLMYSDGSTNAVNKIQVETIDRQAGSHYTLAPLAVLPERLMEFNSKSRSIVSVLPNGEVQDYSPPASKILAMYDAAVHPYVNSPGGVSTDGTSLFWPNRAGAELSGLIVRGEVNPSVPLVPLDGLDREYFPATPVALVAEGGPQVALNVVSAGKNVFFTGVHNGVRGLYGVSNRGGSISLVSSKLHNPSGLAWDGKNTVFVSDSRGGDVWSFAAGRLMSHSPLTHVADVPGASGLAFANADDPAFASASVRADRMSHLTASPGRLLHTMTALRD